MNVKNLVRTLLVVVAVICVSASYVRADKLQLQKKLSQDVEIRLNNVTITEALEKIGQQAGVKFTLSDEAAWKLPQREATRLSVALAGPLAESMTEMLNVFFMRYAVGDEEITIYPRPQLEHILGRPTTKQLELLKAIHARPIKTYFLDKIQTTVNEALGQEVLILPIHVHAQLNNSLRQLVGKDPIYEQTGRRRTPTRSRSVIEPPQPEPPEPTEYELPTPVTLVQLLSQVILEDEPRYTRWYISGMDFPGQSPEVRVVNSVTFGELRRNQTIDITYRDEQLDKILQSLANRAGSQLHVDGRSYLHEHKLSVNMQNVPIAQAMTAIAHMVGASCDFRGSYMQIKGPGPKTSPTTPRPAKTTAKTAREGYVGKISIPMEGGKYYIEFMLRESDLTEELKKLRAEKMEQVLGKSPKAPPKSKPKK